MTAGADGLLEKESTSMAGGRCASSSSGAVVFNRGAVGPESMSVELVTLKGAMAS
jgi:hypothetical protein